MPVLPSSNTAACRLTRSATAAEANPRSCERRTLSANASSASRLTKLPTSVASGGLLPRRQTISGLRRSPESRGPGHHAHRSPDLLYLRSRLTLVRAGRIPTDGELSPRRLWYLQKASISFEDILRTLRHATWQERIFSDPTLDAHSRKLLQPFVEWAKALA